MPLKPPEPDDGSALNRPSGNARRGARDPHSSVFSRRVQGLGFRLLFGVRGWDAVWGRTDPILKKTTGGEFRVYRASIRYMDLL